MIAVFALATQYQSPVKVGMDLATVGKVYPSRYRAVVDPVIMPKLDKLAAKKRKTFSGQVYVRNFHPDGGDRMFPMKDGQVFMSYPGVDIWNDDRRTLGRLAQEGRRSLRWWQANHLLPRSACGSQEAQGLLRMDPASFDHPSPLRVSTDDQGRQGRGSPVARGLSPRFSS